MAIVNKNPEYFLTIAQVGNISKAADILYVSQSYLSQYVSKLETSFDVKLFDRSKTPIELTEAGRIYYNYLQESNKLYTKLMFDFDTLNQKRASTFNLGMPPWRGATMLPEILPIFLSKNHNVNINLHEYSTRQLYDLIEKNIIDVAIMNAPFGEFDSLTTELIKYEKIVLIINKNNLLVPKLKEIESINEAIDINALSEECIILITEGMACAEQVYRYLKKVRFSPARCIVTSNKTTACNLVIQNIGVSFMPEGGIRWYSRLEELCYFDLHADELITPLVAVYKKNVSLSNVARQFVDIVKEYYVR